MKYTKPTPNKNRVPQKGGKKIQEVICPLDNKPCEHDCPDRYVDQPEGGCFITTALEQGFTVVTVW